YNVATGLPFRLCWRAKAPAARIGVPRGSRTTLRYGTPVNAAVGGPVNALCGLPPPRAGLPGTFLSPRAGGTRARTEETPVPPAPPPGAEGKAPAPLRSARAMTR